MELMKAGDMINAEQIQPQLEIAYHYQNQLERYEKVMVGVNQYKMNEPHKRNSFSTTLK